MKIESVDPADISKAMQKRLQSLTETQAEWDVVEDVVASDIAPLVERLGLAVVLEGLERGKDDPLVAAVLVDAAGIGSFRLPRPHKDVLRITEIYSDDEIIGSALAYLAKFPHGTLRDGLWGWTTLWNGWEQLERPDHLRLVVELIKRAPDNDEILAAVADGPVRQLFDEGDEGDALLELARSEPKIARVLRLL